MKAADQVFPNLLNNDKMRRTWQKDKGIPTLIMDNIDSASSRKKQKDEVNYSSRMVSEQDKQNPAEESLDVEFYKASSGDDE